MEGTRRVGENRGRGSNKIGLDGWVSTISTILYIHGELESVIMATS